MSRSNGEQLRKLLSTPCRCQPALGTTPSHRLAQTFFYTIVRSTMQHLVKQERHVKASRTYPNPYKHDNNTNATEDRGFGGQLYMG